MRRIALASAALLTTPALIPADVSRPASSEHGYFPLIVERRLEAPIADATAFALHNLALYGIRGGGPGPQLHRLPLHLELGEAEVDTLSTTGLPDAFQPALLDTNSFASMLVCVGTVDGALVAFRGPLSEEGTVSRWTALPPFPTVTGTPHALHHAGAWTLFFTEQEDGTLTGWAANTAAITDQFAWIEIPSPPERRSGATLLVAADRILLAGGENLETGNPARQTLALGYELPAFLNWEEISLPLPRPLPEVHGASHGGYHLLVPRAPLPVREGDSATSQTVFSTFQRPSGTLSTWRENDLSTAPTAVREALVDPGHRWLVLLGEIEDSTDLMLSSYALPAAFLARHRGEDELLLDRMEEIAPEPLRRSVEETLRDAEVNGQLALVVITGGDRREDLELRMQMRSSRYRYMTQNTAQTYLGGDEGRRLMDQHGITETPAMLLMNSRGELVRQHSGSVPSAAELFELTSPTRTTPVIPPPEE